MNLQKSENLNLHTINFDSESIYSEKDELRNLKDENGRLMKLLQEKDLEIKRLNVKIKKPSTNLAESTNINVDNNAAMKIIELSKKLRESAAELETYKTKYNETLRDLKSIENKDKLKGLSNEKVSLYTDDKEITKLKEIIKVKDEKLADLTLKNDKLTKDIQASERIIRAEVGCGDGTLDIKKLLQEPPTNWKGRAQKIAALQNQVEKLKAELKQTDRQSLASGASSLGWKNNVDVNNGDAMSKLRKEKQLEKEKWDEEKVQLQNQVGKLKTNCDGLRARNESLNQDIARLKKQIKDMLDKTSHDDELIASLLQRQEQLKTALEHSSLATNREIVKKSDDVDQVEMEHLRKLIVEKEEMLRLKNKQMEELEKEKLRGGGGGGGGGNRRDNEEELLNDGDRFEASIKTLCESYKKEVDSWKKISEDSEMKLQDSIEKNYQLKEESSILRQEKVRLEKEIQKLVPNKKWKNINFERKETDEEILKEDVEINRDNIDKLQDLVLLNMDRVESLKSSLEMLSEGKRQDLDLLKSILEETRMQFVEAIKKLKLNPS